MSNASAVQDLCILLSNNQMNQDLFPGFFKHIMSTAAIAHFHTTASPITLTEQESEVNLPGTTLALLTLIYDNTVLSDLELRELESLNPGWRNVVGSPIGYTRQAETVKTVEVFPIPFETSPLIIPVHGLPTGEDYAPGNGIAIYEQLAPDCLPYLILPIALLVLEREYVRESSHTDMAFALACGQLGALLVKMLT